MAYCAEYILWALISEWQHVRFDDINENYFVKLWSVEQISACQLLV